MPAGGLVRAGNTSDINLSKAWSAYTASYASARATYRAAINAASPADPASVLQSAFTTYRSAIETALKTLQTSIGGSLDPLMSLFSATMSSNDAMQETLN